MLLYITVLGNGNIFLNRSVDSHYMFIIPGYSKFMMGWFKNTTLIYINPMFIWDSYHIPIMRTA